MVRLDVLWASASPGAPWAAESDRSFRSRRMGILPGLTILIQPRSIPTSQMDRRRVLILSK